MFRALAGTGRALEVNTSSPLASVDQVRWFHEEGGEAVSFGSDAHAPDGGRPALRPRRRRRRGGRLPARARPLRLLAPVIGPPSTSPLRNFPLGSRRMTSRRVVIALGRQRHDRARTARRRPAPSGTPSARRPAHIADVVATGVEVVLTHGNGPQVGNLLVKNELAAHVVPPVPLDWCVAQTQATIGFTLADELDAALAARGLPQRTAGLVTRTLVDVDDPGFREPSKPVGRFLPARGGGAVRLPRPDLGGPRRDAAGAGWSPPPSRGPSSTPPPSTPWPRPASSSSAPAAAASR